MATTYAYKATDAKGRVKNGKVSAPTSEAAVRQLNIKGLKPVTLEETEAGGLSAEIRIPGITDRVAAKEVAVFSRQFATMIASGLSLLRSLSILAEQTENTTLAGVILAVKADVEKGESLSRALEAHPKVFSKLYTSMVKAGETGGVLDDSLLRLADTLEAQVALKNKIRSAMMYPVAVSGLVVIIVAAMLVFIVPMFAGLYDDLGGFTLPVPTLILLAISNFITSFWWMIMGGSVAGFVAFRKWKQTEAGTYAWDSFKLKMPIFGKLIHKTALARFSHTMSALTRTGVPILQALKITKDTIGNEVIQNAVQKVHDSIKEGDTIAAPLDEAKVFPAMVVNMIDVGEETGSLDTMLLKVAEVYDAEVEAAVEAMLKLMEPMIIILLGFVIGFIVISLYLPIFSLVDAVG